MADTARPSRPLPRPTLAALAALALLGACATSAPPDDKPPPAPACASGERLPVGQTCSLRVDSAQRNTPLPLVLAPGDRYRVELPAQQTWRDAGRDPVDPRQGDNGADNRLMRWFSSLKRLPTENYMVAGLAQDGGPPVRIGAPGLTLVVAQYGPVNFFANDVWPMHCNNSGRVWVTVRRLAAEP
ncbi:hypothetical protein NYO99_14370 [Pelomonas sp. UHG3]|uniref:Uncharacterized protein n=1 Tax=Roseateles hydrophilus TaxID=2975054 RepID=A0ACC6CCJ2_9BURK|nr:hypothetical protein [Pelomonas sp. UHG3]MCY4746168.1 hypothetical protein [Pelomonas sp. UHG3]